MAAISGGNRVGIAGLGRMGSALLERLDAQGFVVSGWNRTAVFGAVFGAPVHGDIGDLAAASDVIILSLFDDRAVIDVVGALCAHDLSGKLIVDTSTVNPGTLRGLEAAIVGAGARAVDAPIAGGPEMIRAGQAGLYLGGSGRDVDRFSPVAEAIAARSIHVGDLGAGATAKVVNNMLLCGYWQTLKEALQTGLAGGLDMAKMIEFLGESPAATPAFKGRIPVLLGDSDAVGFPVSAVVKDVELFVAVAGDHGVDTPAIRAGLDSFLAAQEQGLGQADLAVMVRAAVAGKL